MIDHASLFDPVRCQDDDSQITEFIAASCDMALGKDSHVEFALEATPAHCPRAGLYLSLQLSIYECQPNQCDLLARAQLDPQESLRACASKTPLSEALRAHPEALARAIEEQPALEAALGKLRAKREKEILAKASKPAGAQKTRARM